MKDLTNGFVTMLITSTWTANTEQFMVYEWIHHLGNENRWCKPDGWKWIFSRMISYTVFRNVGQRTIRATDFQCFSRSEKINVDYIPGPSNALVGFYMVLWGYFGMHCGSTFGIRGERWKLTAR